MDAGIATVLATPKARPAERPSTTRSLPASTPPRPRDSSRPRAAAFAGRAGQGRGDRCDPAGVRVRGDEPDPDRPRTSRSRKNPSQPAPSSLPVTWIPRTWSRRRRHQSRTFVRMPSGPGFGTSCWTASKTGSRPSRPSPHSLNPERSAPYTTPQDVARRYRSAGSLYDPCGVQPTITKLTCLGPCIPWIMALSMSPDLLAPLISWTPVGGGSRAAMSSTIS